MTDPVRRQALIRLLIEPRSEERAWDYGAPGDRYPYWVVAEAPERGIMLVYCEHGFGPSQAWGFLFSSEPAFTSLGMDSQWGWYLEEAFVRSGLWDHPTSTDEPWYLSPDVRFGPGAPRDA